MAIKVIRDIPDEFSSEKKKSKTVSMTGDPEMDAQILENMVDIEAEVRASLLREKLRKNNAKSRKRLDEERRLKQEAKNQKKSEEKNPIKNSYEEFIAEIEESARLEEEEAQKRRASANQDLIFIQQMPDNLNSGAKSTLKDYLSIAGEEIPLYTCTDLISVRRTLVAEFPYAVSLIDNLMKACFRTYNSKLGSHVKFEPSLVWGEPGLGKTRLLRRLCTLLGVPVRVVNVGGSDDGTIFGVSRGYSTALPSVMTAMVGKHKILNPVIIFDEIDKVCTRSNNADIMGKLLGLLEKEEAKTWNDSFIGCEVNMSHVNWLFTANDIDLISAPLKSRLKIQKMMPPEPEHIASIAKSIREDFANELGVDKRFFPGFDGLELDVLTNAYMQHRSVRVLKRQVVELLESREFQIN